MKNTYTQRTFAHILLLGYLVLLLAAEAIWIGRSKSMIISALFYISTVLILTSHTSKRAKIKKAKKNPIPEIPIYSLLIPLLVGFLAYKFAVLGIISFLPVTLFGAVIYILFSVQAKEAQGAKA